MKSANRWLRSSAVLELVGICVLHPTPVRSPHEELLLHGWLTSRAGGA